MCHDLHKPVGSLSLSDGDGGEVDGKGVDGKEEGRAREEGGRETGWCVK